MKNVIFAVGLMGITFTACTTKENNESNKSMDTVLKLTNERDKVFP